MGVAEFFNWKTSKGRTKTSGRSIADEPAAVPKATAGIEPANTQTPKPTRLRKAEKTA